MNILQSVGFKINAKKVARISLFWAVAGALDAIFINLVGSSAYFSPTERYNFYNYLIGSTLSYFISGIVCSIVLIFGMRDRFRKFSFLESLILKSIVLATTVVLLSLAAYHFFFAWIENKSIFDAQVSTFAMELFFSPFHVKNAAFALLMIMSTILFLNISDKYGPGIFIDYFLGKYHNPIEEKRIFLFVDMKSATTIAEQIGHIAFHNLLNDFFRDITKPIIYTKGQVYQYVGDEVIVTWKMNIGLTNFNCLRCYYAMQETISQKAAFYQKKYGLVPGFKAGLHCGRVTTGEIGVIKKDIVYSGDVLNTTSRIQSKCNEMGVKILLSKKLLDLLHIPPHSLQPKKMGDIDLKGKKEKVILYSFES